MTQNILSIFIGVLSGILTSIIIWLIVRTFRKIIIPWYQENIYRGIDISGEWKSHQEYAGKVKVDQIIQIKQKGHRIKGTLVSRNHMPSQGEDVSSFIISGEIFDNYVDIEYKVENKKLIGRGSHLLRVVDGGKNMKGGLVAIDRLSGGIITTDSVIWKREI